jgi:glycosyltransferase involved in cell wall biosynthesis
MRIVMLSQFFPPVLGGLERHVKDLSEALVARGHQVAVITLRQGGWGGEMLEYEEVNGVRIYRLRSTVSRAEKFLFVDERRSYAPPFPDPELTLSIRRILQRERPQIVHAHNWLSFSYLPLKKWSGAKLVVTLHEFSLSCGKWTFIHQDTFCSGPHLGKCWICLRDHYGLVKGTITLSGQAVMSRMQNQLVDMYIPVSTAVAEGSQLTDSNLPYEVIANFIPDQLPELAGNSLEELGKLPDEEYILYVGSFTRQKGVDILLDAYRGLDTSVPLVLVGYEVKEFPLNQIDLPANVHVFKNWPNRLVMEAWRRSAFGVAPSNWPEPSPTVVMEAMVMGKPVIGTRAGGIPDIIVDGMSGLLIPPGDVVALRGAMEQLLRNPSLRRQMSVAARERVVAFQSRNIVPKIVKVYERLCYSEMN